MKYQSATILHYLHDLTNHMKKRRWAQLCPSVYCDSLRIPQDNKSVIAVCGGSPRPHPGAAVPAPVVWTTTLFVLLRHPTLGSGDTRGHGHWAPDGEGQTAPAEDRWLTLQHSRGEGCLKMMSRCHWVCKTARELTWPLWQVININKCTLISTCHEFVCIDNIIIIIIIIIIITTLHYANIN